MNPRGHFSAAARFAIMGVLCLCVPPAHGALPKADEESLAWVRRRNPEIDLETLAAARRLYATKCGGCHRPHAPDEFPVSKWQSNLLPEMMRRAKLGPADTDLIAIFVLGLADRPKPSSKAR